MTDIRCRAPGCGAGPGYYCTDPGGNFDICQSRRDEHAELVAAGWKWQEVDSCDIRASRNPQRGEE